MRDITERKKYERKIHQLAYYNELTHLPNRKYMEEKLAELLEVSSEKEERKRFAVMFLNIDRFKKVNESYGHQAGDQLIIDAALRMKEATGDRRLLTHFGGDKFCILLSDVTHKKEVNELIQVVLQPFQQPFTIQGSSIICVN